MSIWANFFRFGGGADLMEPNQWKNSTFIKLWMFIIGIKFYKRMKLKFEIKTIFWKSFFIRKSRWINIIFQWIGNTEESKIKNAAFYNSNWWRSNVRISICIIFVFNSHGIDGISLGKRAQIFILFCSGKINWRLQCLQQILSLDIEIYRLSCFLIFFP